MLSQAAGVVAAFVIVILVLGACALIDNWRYNHPHAIRSLWRRHVEARERRIPEPKDHY